MTYLIKILPICQKMIFHAGIKKFWRHRLDFSETGEDQAMCDNNWNGEKSEHLPKGENGHGTSLDSISIKGGAIVLITQNSDPA